MPDKKNKTIQIAPVRTFHNAQADEAHVALAACNCARCQRFNPEGHPLLSWSTGEGVGYALALPPEAAEALSVALRLTQGESDNSPSRAWEDAIETPVVGNC